MATKARLKLLRRIHGKARCDHINVLIRSIVRPYSERTRSRVIGGRCQVCKRDVIREVTALEISAGIRQSDWRAA